MIYQLMKTTPLVGGQVRIDLVADQLAGDPTMLLDEVHVVPLTDRVWYSGSENQLNNKHAENIRELYEATQDTFFKPMVTIGLESKYPKYTSDSVPTDTVDHTYQMGLRRIPSARYGKQFSFLLPMWIDSQEYIERLEFTMHVCSVDGLLELTSKTFTLSDRLRDYLKDYLDGVSSDLVYIGLRNRTAYIDGLEVSSGTVMTKDISDIVEDLLECERPLIDTDTIIASKFAETKTIARQLMNFNLCFSLDDAFPAQIEQTMQFSKLNVWCEARLRTDSGYEQIELKDMYSNYDDMFPYKVSSDPLGEGTFVSGKNIGLGDECRYNVLDYMGDWNDIDRIHSNKIVQPVVHWSFADNELYTWNLYNGFSPLVEDKTGVHSVEGRFFRTPDILDDKYSEYGNSIQWVTVVDGREEISPGDFIALSMSPSSCTCFTPNKFGTFWSKGIKYDIGNTLDKGVRMDDGTVLTSSSIYTNMSVITGGQAVPLETGKVYVAAMHADPEGDGRLEDYVSIVSVTDGTLTQQVLDRMTQQGVRKSLSGYLKPATDEQLQYVFRILSDTLSEQDSFYGLFETVPEHETDGSVPDKSQALVRMMSNVLATVEYPNVVRFGKTFIPRLAPAPSIRQYTDIGTVFSTDVRFATETEYIPMDRGFSTYMMRYDGNIVPQFIGPKLEEPVKVDGFDTYDYGAFNESWRKVQMFEMDSDSVIQMNRFSNQKYQPDYPSIGYFYFTNQSPLDPEKPFVPEGYNGEVCWYRNNTVYYCDPTITFTIEDSTKEEMTEYRIEEIFTDYVASKGYFSNMDEETARKTIHQFIYPMYSHSVDWEYTYLDRIDRYTFTLEFILA